MKLEVGCGRGVGSEIILDRLGAERVTAFDLDELMVDKAQRRLHGRPVTLTVGDVCAFYGRGDCCSSRSCRATCWIRGRCAP